MLEIKNLGVSILYADAFFVTHALRRTKHELVGYSGVVGSDAQIKSTQTLHRLLGRIIEQKVFRTAEAGGYEDQLDVSDMLRFPKIRMCSL